MSYISPVTSLLSFRKLPSKCSFSATDSGMHMCLTILSSQLDSSQAGQYAHIHRASHAFATQIGVSVYYRPDSRNEHALRPFRLNEIHVFLVWMPVGTIFYKLCLSGGRLLSLPVPPSSSPFHSPSLSLSVYLSSSSEVWIQIESSSFLCFFFSHNLFICSRWFSFSSLSWYFWC